MSGHRAFACKNRMKSVLVSSNSGRSRMLDGNLAVQRASASRQLLFAPVISKCVPLSLSFLTEQYFFCFAAEEFAALVFPRSLLRLFKSIICRTRVKERLALGESDSVRRAEEGRRRQTAAEPQLGPVTFFDSDPTIRWAIRHQGFATVRVRGAHPCCNPALLPKGKVVWGRA